MSIMCHLIQLTNPIPAVRNSTSRPPLRRGLLRKQQLLCTQPMGIMPGFLLIVLAVGLAWLSLSPGSLFATTDEEHFDNSIDYTRRLDAGCHFISNVQINFNLEGQEPKKQNLEFQYDRYPDLERLQIKDGATYARNKQTDW